MPCTSAGILPTIAKANPGWNQAVYYKFQQFDSPVVYTPGDNEWADCHKSKQLSAGDPLKELASVRSLFFAKPGTTLADGKVVTNGGRVLCVTALGDTVRVAHRRAYDPIAARMLWVDTPGPCSSNLRSLPYRKIQRPIYPLDV